MTNRELLFLAHRLPYPPDMGDKIRSYHFLRALASQYTVQLRRVCEMFTGPDRRRGGEGVLAPAAA